MSTTTGAPVHAGLPWFDYYNETARIESGSTKLRGTKSVSRASLAKTGFALPHNETVATPHVVGQAKSGPRRVRESP